jgi:hypothetical protein
MRSHFDGEISKDAPVTATEQAFEKPDLSLSESA